MLGFRGHFSAKSRRYSTTMRALRAARTEHQRLRAFALGLLPDPSTVTNTVVVIITWSYNGRGHPPPRFTDPAWQRRSP